MKPLHSSIDLGAESDEDLKPSTAALEMRLAALRERCRDIAAELSESRAMALRLEEAALLLELERRQGAREIAEDVFRRALNEKQYEPAVRACEIVYRCEGDDALAALGQGVWLAVTFPIDPSLTLTMLGHIINDTPDDADGAAVAAATAAYVVDLRATAATRRDLEFFSARMLGDVARRHGGVESQSQFDEWATRLELHDPEKFLVRLGNVVDVLVQDDWWFDRERLRDELPVH